MITIYEDSRQQAGKHDKKHSYFAENGIWVSRTTLRVGDYQLAGDGRIAVDTKKDIQELISDIQVKVATIKEIEEGIISVFADYGVTGEHFKDIKNIIVGKDSGRNVSAELTGYVYRNHLPENMVSRLERLYVARYGFFHRGLVRAQIEGVKLYILVENVGGTIERTNIVQPNIDRLEDLHSWKNPRLFIWGRNGKRKYPYAMTGRRLQTACETMEAEYGCKFEFCRPEDAGERIIEILTKKRKAK